MTLELKEASNLQIQTCHRFKSDISNALHNESKNAVSQGKIQLFLNLKVNTQMENISNFLEACKAYGVPEISCFQTVDLYEDKQTYKVIECLRGVASLAQSRRPDLEFPAWVVRMAKSHPRQFPESVMRRGEMVIPLQVEGISVTCSKQFQAQTSIFIVSPNQIWSWHFFVQYSRFCYFCLQRFPFQYGTNKCASQKGMTPYGLARQIKPDPFGWILSQQRRLCMISFQVILTTNFISFLWKSLFYWLCAFFDDKYWILIGPEMTTRKYQGWLKLFELQFSTPKI